MTKYISLFSGAGGFESSQVSPLVVCEQDPACGRVLRRRMPDAPLHNDVNTLQAPHADFVVGGWPCQDISSAGTRSGLDGMRSGLFFRMVEIAKEAQAHTVIGENVPNLLTVNKGQDFQRVLSTLVKEGYPYIGWRILNARQFGLPQERNRVFVVASKHRELALAIHANQPALNPDSICYEPRSAAFYWTAGGRSACFSLGYSPALKVGASDSKGRSVIAIFREGETRKLSADGCARLQGFSPADFEGESKTDVVRMAGNAVATPMGKFVLDTIFEGKSSHIDYCGTGMQLGFGKVQPNGLYEEGIVWGVRHAIGGLATNLDHFVSDDDGELLSGQAAAGLIVRTVRSGKLLPPELFEALLRLSHERSKYRASRSNSFEALDRLDINEYRRAADTKGGTVRESVAISACQQDLFAM